jgi:hypothetical protein
MKRTRSSCAIHFGGPPAVRAVLPCRVRRGMVGHPSQCLETPWN